MRASRVCPFKNLHGRLASEVGKSRRSRYHNFRIAVYRAVHVSPPRAVRGARDKLPGDGLAAADAGKMNSLHALHAIQVFDRVVQPARLAVLGEAAGSAGRRLISRTRLARPFAASHRRAVSVIPASGRNSISTAKSARGEPPSRAQSNASRSRANLSNAVESVVGKRSAPAAAKPAKAAGAPLG